MNGIQLQTALSHHIGGDGRIDAAADEYGRQPRGADRHAALTADGAAADIGAEVTHLYGDGDVGIFYVDLQMGTCREQLSPDLRRDLGTFAGKALVGALALDLKGPCILQIRTAVFGRPGEDIVKILLTDTGARIGDDTEHLADAFTDIVKVGILILRNDIDGGLGDPDVDLSQPAQPVSDVFEEHILEGTAVESLQDHFAELDQYDFFHKQILW